MGDVHEFPMMARWRKTINIKPILHRDQANTSPEHVSAVSKEIAALIRGALSDAEMDYTLEEAVELMESIEPDEDDAVEVFNSALCDVYNWADRERVWLGI